jgi:hypothetical protein
MPWIAAAAVAAPIVGGLVGNVMAQGDRRKAQQAMKQAMAELEKVGVPPDLSAQIILKEFQQVGVLTPELEEDIGLAQSEYNNIKEDESLRSTQLEALSKFKQQAQGGLAGDERAAMNEILQKQRQEQQAAQQNILNDQARRGMGGSGAGLVAQLQATQSAAGNASNQGMDLMSLLAQRVRQGSQDMASTAQNIRGQDYNVASDRASALDARNQYLHQNSQARQSRNVDSLNRAQAANLATAQEVNNANVQQANAEKLRQRNEEGSYWDRKLGYGQAKANAQVGQAGNYNAQAQNTANMYSGIGSGIGQGAAAYGQYKNSQNQNNMYAANNGLVQDANGNWVKK